MLRTALVVTFFVTCSFGLIELSTRPYDFDQPIPVEVDSLSPFENGNEKYDYDHLPWPCKPKEVHLKQSDVGSQFLGERARESLYQIRFRRSITPSDPQHLCEPKDMSKEDVNAFIEAIKKHYEYEMRVDDLPVFGQVGLVQIDEVSKQQSYFFLTHRHFQLTYNHDRVITCNVSREVTTNQYVELTPNEPVKNVQFTYSVSWSRTNIPYQQRWVHQLNAYPSRYQVEAHWLWIMNSSLLVVLLTGLFSMILLRTLKNDVARYLQLDQIDHEDAVQQRESNDDSGDDSGWKRIRFDVFRAPKYPLLMASIVGVGAQLLMIVVFLLFLAVVGAFYPGNHGRIYVACLLLYLITAYVAGYVAASKRNELDKAGSDWMTTLAATSGLFAGPFLIAFSVVNSVAISYGASTALPFATILTIVLLWAFVTLPLTAFGAYRGSKVEAAEYPCIVKRFSRPLPEDLPWYHNPILQILTAGFLPFMSIYVELGTIFMSIWGHQPYTLFGILALTFIILLIVTSFAVILMAYFQLAAEDYRWWWASIFRGGACGIFMYAYAWYYWVYQSHMSGAMQGIAFFAYTAMVSYAFSLMLGAVGHWASRWFVIRIYKAIKSD